MLSLQIRAGRLFSITANWCCKIVCWEMLPHHDVYKGRLIRWLLTLDFQDSYWISNLPSSLFKVALMRCQIQKIFLQEHSSKKKKIKAYTLLIKNTNERYYRHKIKEELEYNRYLSFHHNLDESFCTLWVYTILTWYT